MSILESLYPYDVEMERCLETAQAQVRFIALQIRRSLPRHVEFDELVSEGWIGLLQAVRAFDPAKRVSFRTYAEHRIRGAILDGLRRIDPVPRALRAQSRWVEQAVRALSIELRREPTEEEIAARLHLSLFAWEALRSRLQRAGVPIRGEWDRQRVLPLERLPCHAPDPEETADRSERFRRLANALRALSEADRHLLRRRYAEEWTWKRIADEFGVSESQANQLHAALLRRLRAVIARNLP